MPKAMTALSTNRRAMLTGFAPALALAAIGTSALAKRAGDEDLLMACQGYFQNREKIERLSAVESYPYGSAENIRMDAEMDNAVMREGEFLDNVSRYLPATEAGLRAKASVARHYLHQYLSVFEYDADSAEMKIVFSLLDNLAASHGGQFA